MIIKPIYNRFIPTKGFKIVNILGILFVRKEYKGKLSDTDFNHERIHSMQILEMLILPFYLWYLIEWIINIFKYKDSYTAYRNISLEREAYRFQDDIQYLKRRKLYNWFRILRKKKDIETF